MVDEDEYAALIEEFEKNLNNIKQQHDMAVLLGSVGVNPKYMNMYFDSVNRINDLT